MLSPSFIIIVPNHCIVHSFLLEPNFLKTSFCETYSRVASNMKTGSRCQQPSKYDRASLWQLFSFSYVFPLFLRAIQNNGLSFDDLDRCPKEDEVEVNLNRLARNWNQDKRRQNPRFWWTLVRTFGPDFIAPILCVMIQEFVIRIAQGLFLGLVIRYFSDSCGMSYTEACYWAGAVCVSAAIHMMIYHPMLLAASKIGMRLRVSCSTMIYRKALRLNQASLGQTAVGQIVNIMSNDVNRFDLLALYLPFAFVAPFQTAMVVYILWLYLGRYCLYGLGLLLLFIPFQFVMGKLFTNVRSKNAPLSDLRLRFMHEIISGMRVIKMYCWEKPFAERIAETRNAEVSQIRAACYLKAVNLSVFFVATRIIVFVSFVAFVLSGHILTAEAVFVAMTLFNTIRYRMTYYFPLVISLIAELKVTCQRIQDFLLLEENSSSNMLKNGDVDGGIVNLNFSEKCLYPIPDSFFGLNYNAKAEINVGIVVERICAKWNPNLVQPTLKDISLKLEPGDLLAVIGPVGSGKSSFLMTLLQELPVISGNILMDGELSYAGQDTWSFNDTVFNNILFGMDYDPKLYDKVIDVCALNRDLELMPFGDQTLVGEQGVSLSGGQKARINLARAVYRTADIYLLDDPLSAVDASVAEHIFQKCIVDHLKSKIRILVTHQIQFIQKATKILVLKDGQSVAFGSYDELRHLGIDFMSMITTEMEDETQEAEAEPIQIMDVKAPEKESFVVEKSSQDLNNKNSENNNEKDVVKEEQHHSGSIDSKVYLDYFQAGSSYFLLTVMVVFTVMSQSLLHGSDIFLSYWTNKNQLEDFEPTTQHKDVVIYSVLIGGLFVTTVIRSVSFFAICMRASENLHNQIFCRLLRTAVTFFDSTPSGQILNRFSKDMGIVDEMLSSTGFDINQHGGQAIGVLITAAIVTWHLAIPGLAMIIVTLYMRKLYIITARDIKRLEGIARSPVFSHLNTTINGLTTVRAFGMQQSFVEQFNTFQNDHNAIWFIYLTTSRALGVAMDSFSVTYLCVITSVTMMYDGLPGGSAGLTITSGLMLCGLVPVLVNQVAEFESQMTSVERIVEYKYLEQEAPAESSEELKPEKDWPDKGEIHFEDMSLIYRNNKCVLDNINCRIGGGEKIGIVGRTGAGKSSLIAALFRLTEPKGAVRIDGVDIQSIGLDDLRQKISIIPQDPVIYSGTIRYNLDPFGQYSDTDIWSALDQVQLKTSVSNFAGKLEAQLNQSGANLSVGQRQLICLARAILRRNRILVLDEATANIDHQTDNLIQETIRTQFVQCTVLTIAHRLNTIIDSDRVLVLDAGQIVEFDTPYLLLQRQGDFYDMCQKTGPKMYAHLHQIAESIYQSTNVTDSCPSIE